MYSPDSVYVPEKELLCRICVLKYVKKLRMVYYYINYLINIIDIYNILKPYENKHIKI